MLHDQPTAWTRLARGAGEPSLTHPKSTAWINCGENRGGESAPSCPVDQMMGSAAAHMCTSSETTIAASHDSGASTGSITEANSAVATMH
jgi:hypothetical protein